ncbi:polysaccharide deacetylase family protein [Pseudoflavonifractor sp. HCP28S3_F10]|uniref:polysaccharide deacetylase family protein n=1 Tax=Pseudoflavonifractor sp. HCP28S3_F10 TaxID=3438947 RepID=UPI003F8B7B48
MRRKFTSPWGNEDTQQLIDILGKYHVTATFFVVGDWVDKYPESVKALHDAGHEVMNHSNTHAHMNQLSSGEIIADVEACNDKIEAVTGVRPTLIRPPYGEYNDTVISSIRSIGMEPIQWDVDGSHTPSSRRRTEEGDDHRQKREAARAASLFDIFRYTLTLKTAFFTGHASFSCTLTICTSSGNTTRISPGRMVTQASTGPS